MLRDMRNAFFLKLRNTLQLSRAPYKPPYEAKINFVGEAQKRFDELSSLYDIQSLRARFSQGLYTIQLYHLDMLDRFVSPYISSYQSLRVFDPGCDNWHYAPGVWTWARRYAVELQLDGMELDPWRMYINGHTKQSFAKGIIEGYAGLRYIHGDIRTYNQRPHIIFSSLPFIVPQEARAWQLPKKYYDPEGYLRYLWDILLPQGILIVVNIDVDEYAHQEKLYTRIGVTPVIAGEPFTSVFCEYPTVRRVSVLRAS